MDNREMTREELIEQSEGFRKLLTRIRDLQIEDAPEQFTTDAEKYMYMFATAKNIANDMWMWEV